MEVEVEVELEIEMEVEVEIEVEWSHWLDLKGESAYDPLDALFSQNLPDSGGI